MSRVGVATPALQRPREPFFDAMPALLARRAPAAAAVAHRSKRRRERSDDSKIARFESKLSKMPCLDCSQMRNFIRRAPPRPHACPCFGSQALTIGGRPNSAKIYGIESTGSPCITTGERVAIFRIGFALRCFQRLSVTAWLPGAALSDNRCTRGRHCMFLSY